MNRYQPPETATLRPAASKSLRVEPWRTRSATALRLYVVSQYASAAVTTIAVAMAGIFLVTQSKNIEGGPLAGLLSAWYFQGLGVLAVACDMGAIAANFLTMNRARNRTRAPSVFGALLGLAYWPCVVILAQTSGGMLIPFVVGAPRAAVLLFSLTAVSVARDAANCEDVPRLHHVGLWQGVALAFVLIGAATQGTAGASPLSLAIPALVTAVASVVFLLVGAPTLLRLSRVL